MDRKKWATIYDGLDAIFFCIAISEYDQLVQGTETGLVGLRVLRLSNLKFICSLFLGWS